MDNSKPSVQFSDPSFYSAHFMDLALWEPYVRRVISYLGFTSRQVIPGLPGTFPTFTVELDKSEDRPEQGCIVVKFFGPLFEGKLSFQIERAMGYFLAQHTFTIRSPAIMAEGQLTDDWSYLVFEHIPGMSLGQVRQNLAQDARQPIARQLGIFLKELHHLTATSRPLLPLAPEPASWEYFKVFLEKQRANLYANHQHWDDLPSHLLDQLPGFIPSVDELVDISALPHLIHGDLTADHLLGRLVPTNTIRLKPGLGSSTTPSMPGWESSAVIDWGDCRVGNVLYELVALHIDLFQTDKNLLHLCLEAYNLPLFFQSDFAYKALSMLLLHQFPLPSWLSHAYSDIHSLKDLAKRLFEL